jgi:hypothetical protein
MLPLWMELLKKLHYKITTSTWLKLMTMLRKCLSWDAGNLLNGNVLTCTNHPVTVIFTVLLDYKCGILQGNEFSVEIANMYAMLLLIWWNMGPVHHKGTIAPFTSRRHGFPLLAGGILKPVPSLAYVDDAKCYVTMPKSETAISHLFETAQGYCDLLADLSLVMSKSVLCIFTISQMKQLSQNLLALLGHMMLMDLPKAQLLQWLSGMTPKETCSYTTSHMTYTMMHQITYNASLPNKNIWECPKMLSKKSQVEKLV